MAKLTAAQRKKLPKSDFLVPSKAPGPGSYPVPDKAHAVAAKSYARFADNPAKIKAGANKVLGKDKKSR